MHGLILAGGLGSRLLADGVVEPKPLVRIGGQPQVVRLCETLEALGCATVTCLVRAGVAADVIARHGARRRVVSCTTPSSLHTLALGFEAVPAGPVFCTMVDTVMPWESWLAVWTAWQAALAQEAAALLAVTHPSARDHQPLYVQVDDDGWISAIGATTPGAPLATAGVYGFAPAVRPMAPQAMAHGVHRMRGFLAWLARSNRRIHTAYVARALDLDHREDLDEANTWAPMVHP